MRTAFLPPAGGTVWRPSPTGTGEATLLEPQRNSGRERPSRPLQNGAMESDWRNVRRSITRHRRAGALSDGPSSASTSPGSSRSCSACRRRRTAPRRRGTRSATPCGRQQRSVTDVLRIVAHARGADLVNRPARRQRLAADLDVLGAAPRVSISSIESAMSLAIFISLSPKRVVEPQHRDAPRVLHARIEQDAVLLARQHLAEAAEADQRRIVLAHARLERLAEARRCRAPCSDTRRSRRRPGSGSRG